MHATSHGVAARFLLQPQKMRSVLSPEPLASFLRSRGSATMQVPLAWQPDVQRKRLLWSAPIEILRYGASKLKAYLPKSQGQSFAAVHVRAQAATECLSLAGTIFGPFLPSFRRPMSLGLTGNVNQSSYHIPNIAIVSYTSTLSTECP